MGFKQPKVLIVILNYGTFELTLEMIDQIKHNLNYNNYSIMVVDNCSPNESATVLRENSKAKGFIFYANKKNTGYAAGNNIGIRYGIKNGYEYSWILNNDVLLREGNVLTRMIEVAEKNYKIACVGPKVYSSQEKVVAPFCNRPTLWNMTLGIKHERDYRNTQSNTTREVYCIFGCCVLLRNSAMKEIDCMDERTFLYGEESILAERLLNKGYISYYVADVSVKHNEGTTTTKMTKDRMKMRLRENKRSRELYLKEYRHFSSLARWLCNVTRLVIVYFRK